MRGNARGRRGRIWERMGFEDVLEMALFIDAVVLGVFMVATVVYMVAATVALL